MSAEMDEETRKRVEREMSTDPDSGFGFRSTADDVVAGLDLSGNVYVVTGGSSGLGLETCKALARRGGDVVVAVRRPGADDVEAALAEIREAAGAAERVRAVALDLGSQKSVRSCAKKLLEEGRPLKAVICNAGIMAVRERRTSIEGYELQLAVNHLGHFLFTNMLVPLLRAAAPSRVVVVSSVAHEMRGGVGILWDDMHFTKPDSYNKWVAYSQAKGANVLYARELNRRLAGSGVEAFSLHPGGIMTNLQRELPKEEMAAMGWLKDDGTPLDIFKSTEQGAATSVFAATAEYLTGKGGAYLLNCGVSRPGCARCDSDEEAAKLWAASEDMVGEEFSF